MLFIVYALQIYVHKAVPQVFDLKTVCIMELLGLCYFVKYTILPYYCYHIIKKGKEK